MKKQSGRKGQSKRAQVAERPRDPRVERVMLSAGYAIVVLAVLGGFLLSFYPRAFGLTQTNPAVGFGLAALAAFRLYALKREMKRQTLVDGR